MRRYFFQIHGEHGTEEDSEGVALSGHSVAMLHAVTMCAEIGGSGGFRLGFAVSVWNEHGTAIGGVSVAVAAAPLDIKKPRQAIGFQAPDEPGGIKSVPAANS